MQSIGTFSARRARNGAALRAPNPSRGARARHVRISLPRATRSRAQRGTHRSGARPFTAPCRSEGWCLLPARPRGRSPQPRSARAPSLVCTRVALPPQYVCGDQIDRPGGAPRWLASANVSRPMARARRREPGGRGSSRTCISKPRSQVLRRHSSNLHSTPSPLSYPWLEPRWCRCWVARGDTHTQPPS